MVLAGVGGVEADSGLFAAGLDGGVPGLVGEGDGGAVLGVAGVPELGDLLVAVEGEGEDPAVDGGGAGVVDDDAGGEAGLPVLESGVGDVALDGRWGGGGR